MAYRQNRVPALFKLVLHLASCAPRQARTWRVEERGPVAAIRKQPDSARVVVSGNELLMLNPVLQGDSIAGVVRSATVCGDNCITTFDSAAVIAVDDVTSVSLMPGPPNPFLLLAATAVFVGLISYLYVAMKGAGCWSGC